MENVQKGVELGQQVTELWLEFIGDPSNSVPEAKQAEIEAHDCVLYEFQRKDPGNAVSISTPTHLSAVSSRQTFPPAVNPEV